jgi:hypothetical protein
MEDVSGAPRRATGLTMQLHGWLTELERVRKGLRLAGINVGMIGDDHK